MSEVESGEGIESVETAKAIFIAVGAVESGEGIESRLRQSMGCGLPLWNPVKELKGQAEGKEHLLILPFVESGEGIESYHASRSRIRNYFRGIR